MSESSKDKTRRKLIKVISELNPVYATSLFLTDYLDKGRILDLYSKIRTPIARSHKDTTIIFYLRTCQARKSYIYNTPRFSTSGGLVRMPMIQLFSRNVLDNTWIEECISKKLDIAVNVRTKPFNIDSWTKSVKAQAPLNLAKVIGTNKFRRYNVVNKQQKSEELSVIV